MIKNKESLVKQFRSDDPSTYLSNEDQQKAMLLETIEDKKVKAKKRVVEPIEIPVNITIPHRRPDPPKHYHTRPRKVINSNGLSRAFTQDKLREGKILNQVDKELANERMNDERMNNGEQKN